MHNTTATSNATDAATLDAVAAEAIRELIAAAPTANDGRAMACQVLLDALEHEVSLNARTAEAESRGLARVASLRERVAMAAGE